MRCSGDDGRVMRMSETTRAAQLSPIPVHRTVSFPIRGHHFLLDHTVPVDSFLPGSSCYSHGRHYCSTWAIRHHPAITLVILVDILTITS